MKFCPKCQVITTDEQKYCAHDGQLLSVDPLATALQESVGAKYTVTRQIGTGSMGAVYRAQHHALGDVAIKVMLGPPDNHKLSERFLREARALRKLQTPHAVHVYDLERSATGLTYMVMEMVEGRSLRDELKERGTISLEETIEIAEAVCEALSAAHEQGIIHRDLKPDNILLADTNGADERLIKIVDFGIAKLRGTEQGGEEASMQLTKYGTPIGTPFYMSPEQWFGDGPGFTRLDGRTDIYALSCTLYEALSGRAPFAGQSKEELRHKHLNEQPRPLTEATPRVPEPVSRVILRALEKDRDFRPASADEFSVELRRAFDESMGYATEEERRRSRAKTTPPQSVAVAVAEEEQSAQAQGSPLQTTEESVPILRDWVAGAAQAAIEQVRDQPRVDPQVEEPPVVQQAGTEQGNGQAPLELAAGIGDPEATLEPGKFRFEAERFGLEEDTASFNKMEFEQTLILDKARRPAPEISGGEVARHDRRESAACELLLAQAGGWHIGLLTSDIESVSPWQSPVPLPHAPPAVLGIVSVRGRMLTLIDPSALLGEGHAKGMTRAPAFIIELRGDEQLALAVTRVDDTIGIFAAEIELSTQEEAAGSSVMRGIVQGAHGQTIVLDPSELFHAAMRGAERRRKR